MSRAFPERSECPVPSVTAIEGTLAIGSVPAAPPLEYCFNPNLFPTPDPTAFTFGCYPPGISIQAGPNNQLFKAELLFPNSSETGTCEPKFDFIIGCPLPQVFVHAGPPNTFDVTVTNVTHSPGDCSLRFDFTVGLSSSSLDFCVQQFTPSLKIAFGSEFGRTFEISRNPLLSSSHLCAFDFNLDLTIPCNEFHMRNITVTTLAPGIPGYFTPSVTVTTRSQCAFSFDFDIGFPTTSVPCASFSVRPPEVFMGFGPFANLSFHLLSNSVDPTDPTCHFNVNLHMGVPCAEMDALVGIVGTPEDTPALSMVILSLDGMGSACKYLFVISGHFPSLHVLPTQVSNSPGYGACCTPIEYIIDVDLTKITGRDELQLSYTTKTFKLPSIELQDGMGTTRYLTDGPVSNIQHITDADNAACSPCGQSWTQSIGFTDTSGTTDSIVVLKSAVLLGGSCNKSLVTYTKTLRFKRGIYIGSS